MKFYKIMKKPILFLGILIILIYSCKKYEDGPLISFKTPLNRLIGKWQVYYFEMNSVDQSNLYIDSCNCNFSFINKKSTLYFRYYNCKPNYGFSGDFKLKDDNNIIETSTGLSYKEDRPDDTIKYFNVFGDLTSNIWIIKRLTSKDLWINCENNSLNFFFKLKKVGKNEG